MTNRFRARAIREIQRHAKHYIGVGVVATVEEFTARFGWDVEHLARDLQWNGCHCCAYDCLALRFSPRSMTVYIIDPLQQPDYVGNAALLCPRCGIRNRLMPQERWIEFRRHWTAWKTGSTEFEVLVLD